MTLHMIRSCAAPVVASILFAFGIGANAQTYPVKPIRLVVPFPPGGTTDATSRMIAARIAESFGQQMIVENRPGASGLVGADVVAKSAPDGYTLINVVSSHVIFPSLVRKVPFDPIKDFTPVIMLVRSPMLFCVHPTFPARNVKQLVAMAKARPGDIVYGTAGTGTSNHLTGERFKLIAGINLTHVPYRGGGPAAIDLMGGQIPMTVSSIATVTPLVKAGRIRAIAITTEQRRPSFPDVPTVIEQGYPGFEELDWWAILAPAGVPTAIVDKLNAEIARIMRLPESKARLDGYGVEFMGGSAQHAAEFMRAEQVKLTKVLVAIGHKPE